jgi:hypothetical protein
MKKFLTWLLAILFAYLPLGLFADTGDTTDVSLCIDRGSLSLRAPASGIDLGTVISSNADTILSGQFSGTDMNTHHFWVEDLVGSDSGWYVTIKSSELSGYEGALGNTISADHIYIMSESATATHLTWADNTNVKINDDFLDFITMDSVRTYLYRTWGTNNGKVGIYGNQPWIQVNVPGYTKVGKYKAQIEVTLYDNNDGKKWCPIVGQFFDALTDGIEYFSTSFNGITSNGGKFSYAAWEEVTFKIGGILLWSYIPSDSKVFVTDLVGTTRDDIHNTEVVEMGQFLQSIDNDGDPDNGIVIEEDVRLAYTTQENFSDLTITDIGNRVTAAPGGKSLKDAELAKIHLYKTSATTFQQPVIPRGGDISINNDGSTTNSTNVTLNITCPIDAGVGEVQVAYGNNPMPNNWTICSNEIDYSLDGIDGTKRIYVRFRDRPSISTEDLDDDIVLDTAGPNLWFSDDVAVGPVHEDYIIPNRWVDAVVRKRRYNDNSDCSTGSGDYPYGEGDSAYQVNANNSWKYVCLYAEDSLGNPTIVASTNPINLYDCGTDMWSNGSTCQSVGNGFYSENDSNLRAACSNGPSSNFAYTSPGWGGNTCSRSCNSGYYPSGNSCLAHTYTAVLGSRGTCSAVCWWGTQTRSVSCRRDYDSAIVDNSYCWNPASSQSCNTQACTYTAILGSWSTCSATCWWGTQTRSVSCRRDWDSATVSNSYCWNPASSQSCNTQACGTRNVGCRSECNGSSQTRSVTCSLWSDSLCNISAKPATSQSCSIASPSIPISLYNYGAEAYTWWDYWAKYGQYDVAPSKQSDHIYLNIPTLSRGAWATTTHAINLTNVNSIEITYAGYINPWYDCWAGYSFSLSRSINGNSSYRVTGTCNSDLLNTWGRDVSARTISNSTQTYDVSWYSGYRYLHLRISGCYGGWWYLRIYKVEYK